MGFYLFMCSLNRTFAPKLGEIEAREDKYHAFLRAGGLCLYAEEAARACGDAMG